MVGATRLAELTARRMVAAGIQTVLVDEDPDRVRAIVADNPRIIGVCGDPTDPRLIQTEGIDTSDVILALTRLGPSQHPELLGRQGAGRPDCRGSFPSARPRSAPGRRRDRRSRVVSSLCGE